MKIFFPFAIGLFLVALCCFAFLGILYVDKFEEEGYMEFFIKTKPSLFKTNFENPYATDLYGYDNSEEYKNRQDHDGSWLPGTEEFRQFSEYCWYRYGIPQVGQSGRRIECLKLSKEQHNERWPYAPGQFLLWNILVNQNWKWPWQAAYLNSPRHGPTLLDTFRQA